MVLSLSSRPGNDDYATMIRLVEEMRDHLASFLQRSHEREKAREQLWIQKQELLKLDHIVVHVRRLFGCISQGINDEILADIHILFDENQDKVTSNTLELQLGDSNSTKKVTVKGAQQVFDEMPERNLGWESKIKPIFGETVDFNSSRSDYTPYSEVTFPWTFEFISWKTGIGTYIGIELRGYWSYSMNWRSNARCFEIGNVGDSMCALVRTRNDAIGMMVKLFGTFTQFQNYMIEFYKILDMELCLWYGCMEIKGSRKIIIEGVNRAATLENELMMISRIKETGLLNRFEMLWYGQMSKLENYGGDQINTDLVDFKVVLWVGLNREVKELNMGFGELGNKNTSDVRRKTGSTLEIILNACPSIIFTVQNLLPQLQWDPGKCWTTILKKLLWGDKVLEFGLKWDHPVKFLGIVWAWLNLTVLSYQTDRTTKSIIVLTGAHYLFDDSSLGIECNMMEGYECVWNVNNISNGWRLKLEVGKMEADMLEVLKFEMGNLTVKTFVRRFTNVTQESQTAPNLQLKFLGYYLEDVSLLGYNCAKFLPSLVATSVVFLARFMIQPKIHSWSLVQNQYSQYKARKLKGCIIIIHDLYLSRKGVGLQEVREKYKRHKLKCMATMPSPLVHMEVTHHKNSQQFMLFLLLIVWWCSCFKWVFSWDIGIVTWPTGIGIRVKFWKHYINICVAGIQGIVFQNYFQQLHYRVQELVSDNCGKSVFQGIILVVLLGQYVNTYFASIENIWNHGFRSITWEMVLSLGTCWRSYGWPKIDMWLDRDEIWEFIHFYVDGGLSFFGIADSSINKNVNDSMFFSPMFALQWEAVVGCVDSDCWVHIIVEVLLKFLSGLIEKHGDDDAMKKWIPIHGHFPWDPGIGDSTPIMFVEFLT